MSVQPAAVSKADIIGHLINAGVAETVTDAELFDGIDDPRVIRQLKAKLADGSIDRGLLYDAALLRKASKTARSPRRKPSQVYFIGAEVTGLIKIGCAVNPQARLRSLQTGSPDRLSIIATVPGDAAMERGLHSQFAADRMHGEWFRQSPALIELIESIAGTV